jgi:hypothetical protein
MPSSHAFLLLSPPFHPRSSHEQPRLEPAPSSSAFSANDSGLDISDIRKPGETKRRKSVNHTAVEVVTIGKRSRSALYFSSAGMAAC